MISPLNIIFAGTPDFAVPALKALVDSGYNISAVYTQPDRPAGRGRKLTPSPVKQYALAQNIPVYQPLSLRKPEAQDELKSLKPDLMIVAAYGLILPNAILEIPRFGCINIHASLLPRWRGAAPLQRAILAGDTETGITIMQMDAGLDTGDMLYKVSCAILPTDTTQHLHDKLSSIGASAIQTVLKQLLDNKLKPEKQDEFNTCYAPKIEKIEAQIAWQNHAIYIERFIRAFNPWPVAFTFCKGQMIKIWEAETLNQESTAEPGTIIAIDKKGIDIATGQGILRLLTIQLPGGKPLHAQAHINSNKNPFQVGIIFEGNNHEHAYTK
ncbi:MAG: Methionyl-tRNA formyltransferase [Legionellaceae bacterium]